MNKLPKHAELQAPCIYSSHDKTEKGIKDDQKTALDQTIVQIGLWFFVFAPSLSAHRRPRTRGELIQLAP